MNTVCNYHINEMIYCSDYLKVLNTKKMKHFPEGLDANNPLELFEFLLYTGWDKDTGSAGSSWNEQKSYIGQSAATAILLQQCFGGDICLTNFSTKAHYFNRVNGIIVDLTRCELQDDQAKKCYDTANYTYVKPRNGQVYKKNQNKAASLIEKCKNKG